jgi:hypothetical protein
MPAPYRVRGTRVIREGLPETRDLWQPRRVERRRVCEGLQGEILEIGFGTGHNVPFYPAAVTKVAAIEPSDLGWNSRPTRLEASTVNVERSGLDGQSLRRASRRERARVAGGALVGRRRAADVDDLLRGAAVPTAVDGTIASTREGSAIPAQPEAAQATELGSLCRSRGHWRGDGLPLIGKRISFAGEPASRAEWPVCPLSDGNPSKGYWSARSRPALDGLGRAGIGANVRLWARSGNRSGVCRIADTDLSVRGPRVSRPGS